MNTDLKEYKDLLQQAINKWGDELQLRQAQEECAELIHATNKYLRFKNEKTLHLLLEEIADVKIILCQLEMMFGYEFKKIDRCVKKKMKRLEKRLNEHNTL